MGWKEKECIMKMEETAEKKQVEERESKERGKMQRGGKGERKNGT